MFINEKFLLNVLLSVGLLSIFICVFFFTYAKNMEEKIVINQTKNLVDDLTTDILTFKPIKDKLKMVVKYFEPPDMSEQDKKVHDNNLQLLQKVVHIIVIFAIIVFTFVIFSIYIYDLSYYEIFWPNIIILIFVGLTEIFFITFIAPNFISFDPNFAKKSILNVLKEFAYEPLVIQKV